MSGGSPRDDGSGPSPRQVSLEQKLRHVGVFMAVYMLSMTPLTFVLDGVTMSLLQINVLWGIFVIDAELRRMGSCTVLAAQTMRQAARLLAMSAIWPFTGPVVRDSVERYLQRQQDKRDE